MLIENLSLENIYAFENDTLIDEENVLSHVLSSCKLKNVRTLEGFHNLAREHFIIARRREVESIIEWINESYQLPFLVIQPDGSLNFAREFVEFNDSFVNNFVYKFFEDPPYTYLQHDFLLRIFYLPDTFINVMKRLTKLDSESQAIMKLLVERSFEQEKHLLLNKKECTRI